MISMNYQNYPTGHSKLLYHFKDLWQLMGLPDQMKANLSIPTKKLFFQTAFSREFSDRDTKSGS